MPDAAKSLLHGIDLKVPCEQPQSLVVVSGIIGREICHAVANIIVTKHFNQLFSDVITSVRAQCILQSNYHSLRFVFAVKIVRNDAKQIEYIVVRFPVVEADGDAALGVC